MPSLAIKKILTNRNNKGLYRTINPIEHHKCIDFSSNDYLGFNTNSEIISSYLEGVKKYGINSCSSPLVSGYTDAHFELEEKVTQWLNVESAIIFRSGYAANLGLISTLANKSSHIIADKLVHSSLIDGILLSHASFSRYKHNNIEHLNTLSDKHKPDLIITESIFSMEGDITPIKQIVNIARKNQSQLLIDDAHGIGVLGGSGKGVIEHYKLTHKDYTYISIPLGKALSANAAIVIGNKINIDYLRQFARTYGYSTSVPSATCKAITKTIDILQHNPQAHSKLHENIILFNNLAIKNKLPIFNIQKTPIKCILIRDNIKTIKVQKYLKTKGFLVAAIRPPTVPQNTARLRISINTNHTKTNIYQLIKYINEGIKYVQ